MLSNILGCFSETRSSPWLHHCSLTLFLHYHLPSFSIESLSWLIISLGDGSQSTSFEDGELKGWHCTSRPGLPELPGDLPSGEHQFLAKKCFTTTHQYQCSLASKWTGDPGVSITSKHRVSLFWGHAMLWFSFKNNFSLRSCFYIPIAFKCQNRLKICKQLLMVSQGHFGAKKKKKFKLNSVILPGNGKYASCSALATNSAPWWDFIQLREPTQARRRLGLTVRGDVKAWVEQEEPTGSRWEQAAGEGSMGLGASWGICTWAWRCEQRSHQRRKLQSICIKGILKPNQNTPTEIFFPSLQSRLLAVPMPWHEGALGGIEVCKHHLHQPKLLCTLTVVRESGAVLSGWLGWKAEPCSKAH